MIDRKPPLPLVPHSRILEFSRSSLHYQALPVSANDLELMKAIDEIHFNYPFYDGRNIRDELRNQGYLVGRGHIRTLMREMGIEALYHKPRLSQPHPWNKVYPYLLKGLKLTRAKLKVLSWRISNTLSPSFCVEALEEAIARYGIPEIFNNDQSSQFTSKSFTSILESHGIQISMDDRDGGWTIYLWNGSGGA